MYDCHAVLYVRYVRKFLGQHCYQWSEPLPPPPRPDLENADKIASASSDRMLALSEMARDFVQSLTERNLGYENLPDKCPLASDSAQVASCNIILRGSRQVYKYVEATGVWKIRSVVYGCKTHGYRWNLPTGHTTSGCTLVGDVIGHFVIHRSVWSCLWQNFIDTESYTALEQYLRRVTGGSLLAAAAQHPKRAALTEDDRVSSHAALMQHIKDTPDAQTLKGWLLRFLHAQLPPADVANLAAQTIACHGLICNIDFSCSDGFLVSMLRSALKPV